MLRTRQTAAIVAERLGLEPRRSSTGSRRARFGAWDGFTFAEVMARWPDEMAAWLASPDVAPPGGESLHEVSARVGAALRPGARPARRASRPARRARRHDPALTARALDTPASSMNRMELAPASITTLTWYADGNASMRSFAESSHLEALGTTWTP